MMRKTSLFGAVAALGLAAVGCSSDGGTPESRIRHLSDTDGDGMFSSAECDDPSAPEGACVIIPGPTDCDYVIFTSTWTTIIDASGNVVSEGWQDCLQCADAAFNPVGPAECSGGTVDPIVCEPLDDVLPGGTDPSGGGMGGTPRSEADAAPGYPGGGGGGTFPTAICWWCHDSGATSYVECVEPPPPGCTSDDECGPGYHCEYWSPPPCDAPDGTFCAEPAAIVAAGQCVPDYEVYCTNDDECGPGYYCDYGYGTYPTPTPGDGGSAGAPAIAPAGKCAPLPVTDYCYSDEDCRGFGPDWTCVYDSWTCPEGYACPADGGGAGDMPASPVVVSGTCQPPLPPVDECNYLTNPGDCAARGCLWFTYGDADVACAPGEICGYCTAAYDGGSGGGADGSPPPSR